MFHELAMQFKLYHVGIGLTSDVLDLFNFLPNDDVVAFGVLQSMFCPSLLRAMLKLTPSTMISSLGWTLY
jgi:hypothetical protein